MEQNTVQPVDSQQTLNTPVPRKHIHPVLIGIGIVLLLAIGGVGGFYMANTKKYESNTQTQTKLNLKTVTPTETAFNPLELNEFPVYPNSKFIKKEILSPCSGEVSGYSLCDPTVDTNLYTWETSDDYDAVSKFYRKEEGNDGWKCSGGAGNYMNSRDAAGQTLCKKDTISYTVAFDANSTRTLITLAIKHGEKWVSYTSKKLPANSLVAYSLQYPSGWKKSVERIDESIDTLTLTKKGHTIKIYQAPTGGALCVFEGTVPDNVPAGDYTKATYKELSSVAGTFRRVEQAAKNGEVMHLFCEASNTTPVQYGAPTHLGDISYTVPVSADESIVSEMDQIISTLKEANQ